LPERSNKTSRGEEFTNRYLLKNFFSYSTSIWYNFATSTDQVKEMQVLNYHKVSSGRQVLNTYSVFPPAFANSQKKTNCN